MVALLNHKRAFWLLGLLVAAFALTLRAGDARAMPAQATGPATYCPGQRFSDVCPSDWFYTNVMDLSNLGVVSGYTDGTFRPYNTITRGQIMKMLVLAVGLNAPLPASPTFSDVPTMHSFYQWIEVGVANGVASGYTCGGPGEPCDAQHRPYFRPFAEVNRGQLAKMLVNALDWPLYTPSDPTFNDVPTTSPYFGYVERVADYGVIGGYDCGGPAGPCPGRYFLPYNSSTRAQACKIIDNGRTLTPTPTVTGTPPTATPTRTRTPTATPGGPCAVFPTNNIWNHNIAALPTHALSNTYMASIGLTDYVHADFGSGLWEGAPIGIPYVTVPGSQPFVPINFTEYGDESDPGPYPVPGNAPIEGGPNSTGDRHVLVVDTGNCTLYEMYHAYPQLPAWDAGSGAIWHLNSNALRPDTWTSADAAGLPIYAGLVRYDEIATGVIRHALRFTAPQTQQAYVWPARHYASDSTDPSLPPMGLRVRLKASVNISTYPQQARVVLQALKDYGMILADNGAPWYISGAPDERWDNDVLHLLHNLHGSNFEAVDESGLMIDPNSGQSR
jgi:hypothetical protein